MHVIVTAGHVDHGKTSLVDALTGMRSDRLPEEQRRSVSIELGYVWTDLPAVGDVAFVDVPGHERFISTTLAGFGPAAAALLIVAADDPWMPQAEEHLVALEAFGYNHLVVAITRCDLADPEPIRRAVATRLGGTPLAGSASVETSVRTGKGLDQLRAALVAMLQRMSQPDPDSPLRIWVDRRFTVKGTGTVVTGTLGAGSVARGDQLLADGTAIRVRGLQTLGNYRDTVTAPARIAISIGGKPPATLGRGSVLASPGDWMMSSLFDGFVPGHTARLPRSLTLHLGTASYTVGLRAIGDAMYRVRLPVEIPVHVGDIAVLRDPGQRRMWRITVLDPAPPPLTRRGSAAQRAIALEAAPRFPSLESELQRRGVISLELLRQLGVPRAPVPPGTIQAGSYLVGAAHAYRIRVALLSELQKEEAAGNRGITPATAAQRLNLPNPDIATALATAPVRYIDGLLCHAEGSIEQQVRQRVRRLTVALGGNVLIALAADQMREAGLDGSYLRAAGAQSLIIECPGHTLFVAEAAPVAIAALSLLEQPFTASAARVALGLSRKTTLDLLAHLEDRGLVERLADDTRRVSDPGGRIR